jgi:ATP-dependent protease HslVU (ClpYQ) peptidase subunit
MTTIAYKDGMMACDSCWTIGNIHVTSLSKITRLPSGALLGQAGDNDCREMENFLSKVKTPRGLPTRKELLDLRLEYAGLLVLPSKHIFKITCREDPLDYKDEVGFTPISRKFAATGSGNELAIGAMAAGKTAREAVAIACEFDINTRGPVHVVRL